MSSSYKIIDEYSSNVFYELTPNYNISYLKVKYEGKYENNKNNIYIYISVGLASLILIIIIIICIIIRFKRSKSQNLYYSSLETPQQSLTPT